MKTKTKIYGVIALLICIGLVWYILNIANTTKTNCETQAATDINVGGDQNVVYHIHQFLTITINGEQIPIPSNIGLSTSVMRPIHTHDTTGEIHVESPCQRDFTIGDFFEIWGENFNSTCIMDSCVDANHTLTMSVNGIESADYQNLTLRDKQQIEIKYQEKS